MGDTKNLTDKEAIARIKQLVEDAKLCMFNTNLSQIPCDSRPMSVQLVEDTGIIWFFSAAYSTKNKVIAEDPRVHLLFMNIGASEYLSLYGNAEIIKDSQKAADLWNPMAKAWFNDGPSDPELTLIRFTPDRGHYWDTKSNKMISLLKIAIGAITGIKMDGGVEGKINP